VKVLITGAEGFIGKNLQAHLACREDLEIISFARNHDFIKLAKDISRADFIFHLAGVNRPKNAEEFASGNADLTRALCDLIKESGRNIPLIYSSSTQAIQDNLYGRSKLQAEEFLLELNNECGVPVHIFRLPNVFGKWCKPNYNSVVATFCYNIARDLPIQINDPAKILDLVYVDDLIKSFIELLDSPSRGCENVSFIEAKPSYQISVGELAGIIQSFKESRTSLVTDHVGAGITRALYATYVSYLPKASFTYDLKKYEDDRGAFVEFLKTKDSGQFSFFSAKPGVTRGGHYHHSKTEKFLVVQGAARFRFENILTGEARVLEISDAIPQVVETIPGWAHDITNVGEGDLLVILWANEIFDRQRPDTISFKFPQQSSA